MPRAQKLKVYRTPIGFHDAYVAAPSQKAALAAWGSDANLFARGVAELVEDPTLTAEPLARPGEVIRKLRGTAEEQLAALPRDKPKAKAPPSRAAPPKQRPSRATLDKAEEALTDLEAQHRQQLDELARREAALAKERQALETRQRKERDRLSGAAERARTSYKDAMRKWRG
ncbi:hypothetical protein ACFSCW_05490 [Sphingomonas tabacisoli]|uniref:Cell envelope biogenesis protein TolA n=1 Tax=Sphingomonas tabacisoli TaxID=2249466 RepID=A0ABW4I1C9_9SPHN